MESKKYNWIDVEKYAKILFDDRKYEIGLAQDTWNIVMFQDVVTTSSIVPTDLSSDDFADMIVWLLAVLDFIYDYQCVIKDKVDYYHFDIAGECIDTDDQKNYIHYLNYIEEKLPELKVYECLSSLLWLPSIKLLNEKLAAGEAPVCKFINEETMTLYFTYNGIIDDLSDTDLDLTDLLPIAYVVLEDEVSKRRDIVVGSIFKYFDNYDVDIMLFLGGYHYREHYTDYKIKKEELVKEKEEKISVLLKEIGEEWEVNKITGKRYRYVSSEEREIEEEYERKIRDFGYDFLDNNEYRDILSYWGMDQILFSTDFDYVLDSDLSDIMPIYEWVQSRMG